MRSHQPLYATATMQSSSEEDRGCVRARRGVQYACYQAFGQRRRWRRPDAPSTVRSAAGTPARVRRDLRRQSQPRRRASVIAWTIWGFGEDEGRDPVGGQVAARVRAQADRHALRPTVTRAHSGT